MARITVEDCLRAVPNRFQLVNMVSKRVRQIREGSEYLVSSPKNEDIVVALREIAACFRLSLHREHLSGLESVRTGRGFRHGDYKIGEAADRFRRDSGGKT